MQWPEASDAIPLGLCSHGHRQLQPMYCKPFLHPYSSVRGSIYRPSHARLRPDGLDEGLDHPLINPIDGMDGQSLATVTDLAPILLPGEAELLDSPPIDILGVSCDLNTPTFNGSRRSDQDSRGASPCLN